ncbi:MAG TPA: phosphoribosylformylglycinamidine synthase subunit PurQ [Deltaproteobacteria bacterium]|nr:phosphoribosylformylglycinamidine synthase subunit PurQ [Deltaproteobacteria bacterium]HOM28563.1 phosphoribosylformylglycinamidine synthase subunit PurQ [Deltaproteobacteria bacterium]HPP79926.1 phosphoribosylformylglycinamidine synthase subunit PurQ [Deltaproteobacteria bacterium]
MKRIRAIVITGYGTNCEVETAHACRLAGFSADIVHMSEILSGSKSIKDYHFLNLPGGFLDGDDLGSAQVEGLRLRYAKIKTSGRSLYEEIVEFIDRGMLILGVCNGFQALVKSGILPGTPRGTRKASLTFNDSARFEDRWVRLKVNAQSPCVFTRGVDSLELPVRHGEGKFVVDSEQTLSELRDKNMVVMRYADRSLRPTMEYPANPNGSVDAVAGICDPTGRIFGLMPHPEAHIHPTNHPAWTRRTAQPHSGDGLVLFENAMTFLKGVV